MKSMRVELAKQLGRTPNAGEAALIERLCWLQLRLQILDLRLVEGKFTDFDASVYNAHMNSFARGLSHLGIVGKGRRAPASNSLADYFASKRGAA